MKNPLRPILHLARRTLSFIEIQRLQSSDIQGAKGIANAINRTRERPYGEFEPALKRIELAAEELSNRNEPLVDGTLGEPWVLDVGKSVAKAHGVSVKSVFPAFLYWLSRETKAKRALELGTNVGVSSAYIASGLRDSGVKVSLTTLDASQYRQRVAKGLHGKLELTGVSYVPGLFEQTFQSTIENIKPIDFAYIDGDHTYKSTVLFFAKLKDVAVDGAILVFDDIRWSEGMVAAWNEIKRDPDSALALDLGRFGIIVFSKQARKRQQFTIRI